MNRRAAWLWTQRLARLVLGGAFVLAGGVKILGPAESATGHRLPGAVKWVLGQKPSSPGVEFRGPVVFRDEIKNYQLGRFYWLVHPAAIALPWIEVATGLTLILGIWMVESTILIWGMLLFFNFMVASAMKRGLDIRCGCFGGDMKVGWMKLSENFGLILLGVWALIARRLLGAKAPQDSSPDLASQP